MLITKETENIFRAVKSNNIVLTTEICQQEIDIDARDIYGYTPFLWSCKYGYDKITEYLMSLQCDINIKSFNDENGLLLAVQSRNFKLCKLLIDKFDVNYCSRLSGSPLIYACINGDFRIVKLLIDSGAKVDVHKKVKIDKEFFAYINDPIIFHIENLKIVELLVNSGYNINIQNHKGSTILIQNSYGNVERLRTIINLGADINICEYNGFSALMYACYNNKIENAKILLDTGADINAQDINGRTTLMMLCKLGSKFDSILTLLLKPKYGIDLNIQDHEGKTALVHTVIKNKNDLDTTVVEKLIQAKCNIDLLYNGKNVHSIAIEKGFTNHAHLMKS